MKSLKCTLLLNPHRPQLVPVSGDACDNPGAKQPCHRANADRHRCLEAATGANMRGLALFFSLTLCWMGLCGGLAILVAHGWLTLPIAPLALISIGGLMPILAALVAAGHEAGRDGVRALFGQLAYKRLVKAGRWRVVALLGMAVIVLLALLLNSVLGGAWPTAIPATTWQTMPLLAVVYLIIAVIEEVGWRGYTLPRLQKRYGTLIASLLLDLI